MRPFLLFDHDGVLVDSERWYFAASRAALATLGVALDESTYLDMMSDGTPCWELARARGVSESEVLRARGERDALYQKHLAEEPIEIDGVEDVLRQLAPHARMGIVTTSKRDDFEWIHRDRSIAPHFEFVVTVEEVAAAKPAPDPYLAGLRRFDAVAEDAVAVEDSARGLRSAIAAGLDCIVIRTPFTESQDFTGAWKIVDGIRDVPGALGL